MSSTICRFARVSWTWRGLTISNTPLLGGATYPHIVVPLSSAPQRGLAAAWWTAAVAGGKKTTATTTEDASLPPSPSSSSTDKRTNNDTIPVATVMEPMPSSSAPTATAASTSASSLSLSRLVDATRSWPSSLSKSITLPNSLQSGVGSLPIPSAIGNMMQTLQGLKLPPSLDFTSIYKQVIISNNNTQAAGD
jgi:hypothetical protein